MLNQPWQHQKAVPLVPDYYEDGGVSSGTLERALKRLLADVEGGKIDVVVVYKIERLSRPLMEFARLPNSPGPRRDRSVLCMPATTADTAGTGNYTQTKELQLGDILRPLSAGWLSQKRLLKLDQRQSSALTAVRYAKSV